MRINWKVRFKNKVWLTSFLSAIVTFAYTMLDMLGIIPAFPQEYVMKAISAVLLLLSTLGVLVDPTTSGIGDSVRALSYDEPWQDEDDSDDEESQG